MMDAMRLAVAALLVVGLACAAPTSSQAQSTSAPASSPAPAAAPSPAAAPAATSDWPTYQRDLSRSGLVASAIDPNAVQQLWETDQLDGQVYAQPLVVGGRVYVVTENNSVYALDPTNGGTIWMQHLGDPVSRSALPCGNIDPSGITSTPVADPQNGVLYVVDYLKDGPHHEIAALDLSTGAVRFHQPIDPPGAPVPPLQQRGALGLSQGTVYVPFGGLFGDCGDYHGWVVAASAQDGTPGAAYQVPTHREGAIWAAAAFDNAGNVLVATGNGDSQGDYDGSNSVVRLSSDLKLQDFFAPSNWAELSRRDADLGSSGPILLDNNRVLQVGKSGVGYLLDASKLGQIGGEVFQAPLCSGGAYGGAAHAGNMAYVGCRDGLYAVQVSDQSFSVSWHGPQFNAGAPTITDSAVWSIDDGTTSLYALDRGSGNVAFRAPAGQASNPPHFLTPSVADGRVFHSRGRTIVAYGAS
jgi:outer membrane protein assembly factor BamB